MGCNCGAGLRAASRARGQMGRASAASRQATRAATKAAKAAAKGCPSGGCHGKRGVIVSPKTVKPTKVKPCNC